MADPDANDVAEAMAMTFEREDGAGDCRDLPLGTHLLATEFKPDGAAMHSVAVTMPNEAPARAELIGISGKPNFCEQADEAASLPGSAEEPHSINTCTRDASERSLETPSRPLWYSQWVHADEFSH